MGPEAAAPNIIVDAPFLVKADPHALLPAIVKCCHLLLEVHSRHTFMITFHGVCNSITIHRTRLCGILFNAAVTRTKELI